MINLFAGLTLLSVVVALGAAVVPEYVKPWERLKAGLLTLLVMWLVFAGMSSFWLVGTGLSELENAKHDARTEELLKR